MKDFINIDSTDRITKLNYVVKRDEKIFSLIEKEIINSGEDSGIEKSIDEELQLTKVYKSYIVEDKKTLKSIVEMILSEYPKTSLKYSLESLIDEVRRTNKISGNFVDEGTYLTIPYYIPKIVLEDKEKFYKEQEFIASGLQDYELYDVLEDDTYSTIANMYTSKNSEIISIVSELQKLNDYCTLRPGMIIKIPNIEKYRILNADFLAK